MIKKTFQILLVIIMAVLIFNYFNNAQNELNSLKSFNTTSIAYLLALYAIAYLFYGLSIFLLLKKHKIENLRFSNWLRIFFISRFINFHIFQGANIYRSVHLKNAYNFSYANYISTVAFLGWFYTFTTLLFSSFTVQWKQPSLIFLEVPLSLSLFIAGLIIFILPYAVISISSTALSGTAALSKLTEACTNIIRSFRASIHSSSTLSIFFLISLLHFILTILMIDHGLSVMSYDFGAGEVCLLTVIQTLSKYINIVPNNVGITEYLSGAASYSLGDTLGSGILISAVLRILEYVFVLITAVILACLIKKTPSTD